MRVRFWGVRGSVPWTTPASIGVGCNTPCVELTDDATERLLVFDAGSGIVGLGKALGNASRVVPILLSHFHWDHLQGLPFFAPVYRRGWSVEIWAPDLGSNASRSIETLFEPPWFPVPPGQLPARPSIDAIRPGARVGGFDVRTQRLNHPGGALAYRVAGTDGDLVYATDHEFGDRAIDAELASFISGARAVILDAHFTPEERQAHKGWGHGDWSECAAFAAANAVGHLWLFHHKPGRTDEEIKAIVKDARRLFPATDAAREGAGFVV